MIERERERKKEFMAKKVWIVNHSSQYLNFKNLTSRQYDTLPLANLCKKKNDCKLKNLVPGSAIHHQCPVEKGLKVHNISSI